MKCRLPRKKEVAITLTTTLDLSGNMNSNYGYVIIDGTKYSSAQTITAEIGAEVTVFCSSEFPSGQQKSFITKNRVTVAKGTSADGATYTWVITGATEVKFARHAGSAGVYYWTAAITTQ